jgi:hypothetical protein
LTGPAGESAQAAASADTSKAVAGKPDRPAVDRDPGLSGA